MVMENSVFWSQPDILYMGVLYKKKSLEAGRVQNLNYGFKNTGRLAGNWREEFILVVGLKYLQTQRREK
jgi:hypothetical protein